MMKLKTQSQLKVRRPSLKGSEALMLNVFNKLVKYGSYKYTFLYETCIDTESIETAFFGMATVSPRVALVKVLLYGTTYTPAVHRCTITTRHQRLNKITETVARLHLSRATCLAR